MPISESAAPMAQQQINQVTTHTGIGLGLFGAVLGRRVPRLGEVTRYSPIHGANTLTNIATTDISSSESIAVAMASSYAFVGQFIGRGVMRFAPVVGHAVLAHDVARVVAPAIMNQLDARGQAGCENSREAAASIRGFGRSLDQGVESSLQALRVAQARENALPVWERSNFTDP